MFDPHDPLLHVRVVTERVRVPVSSQLPLKPPQLLQAPVVVEPQLRPSVFREHPSLWLDVFDAQVPALQLRVVTERVRVPDSPQVPAKPPQLLHAPVVVEPQLVPSVSRAHPSVWVEVFELQAPLPHVRVVTDRERVPASPHVPLKPPHVLQAPVIVEPQLLPSVSRMQASVCVLVFEPQVPELQVRVVSVRERVPDSPHVPLKPVQLLHAPVVGESQVLPSVSRAQLRDSESGSCTQLPARHTERVTPRVSVPTSPQAPAKPPQLLQTSNSGAPHSVPSGRAPAGTHSGVGPPQSTRPVLQGSPTSVQGSSGTQVSLHSPEALQDAAPPMHGLPTGAVASSGQAFAVPLQTSGTSHSPAASLQTKPIGCFSSRGHSALAPSQSSGRSQGPAASRQTDPALPAPATVQTGVPVEQSKVPTSQGFSGWHGSPHSGGARSVGAISMATSTRMSIEPSIVGGSRSGRSSQPRSLQNSSSLHAPSTGAERHAPSAVHRPSAQSALAVQSSAVMQPSPQLPGVSGEHSGRTQRPSEQVVASGSPPSGHATSRQLRVIVRVGAEAPLMRIRSVRSTKTEPFRNSSPKSV